MKFKDYYNEDCARMFAVRISRQTTDFNSKAFIVYIAGKLNDKTFSQRQDLFADAFEECLPGDFYQHTSIFHSILGPELTQPEGMFNEGWWLWPVGRYYERHATTDMDVSLDFIYELTKRHTGEFAIRPLIKAWPRPTLERMEQWSRDNNVHVRRLSSEGMRTRLPWAKRSYDAVYQFDLYSHILTNLKSDPQRFVQKSVGNNLNDLMKDRPEMVQQIIDTWKSEPLTPATQWIIKHGLRSQRKAESIPDA